MAVKTWTCSFVVMDSVGPDGSLITSVRDKYNSTPSHRTEAGVGGTGEMESKPNNITYMRFHELFASIPKGAKISSAILSWGVNSADWKKSVVHKVRGCEKIGSGLNGTNQPKSIGTVSEYTLPEHAVTDGYSFTADITPTIQYMVNSGLCCMKIYTTPGENRKYMRNTATLTVEYIATTGIPSVTIQSTDCSNNSFANDAVNVQAGRPSGLDPSDTVYYQYKITAGTLSYVTKWVTDLQATLPMLGTPGTVNSITVSSSLFQNGELATSSPAITITKNNAPSISIVELNASNLINNGSQIVVNGIASFRVTATDTSIKKDYTPIINFFVDNVLVDSYSAGLTTTFSYNFNQNKTYAVYAEISDGFITTRTSTLNVKGAAPLLITVTGDVVSKAKIGCEASTSITANAQCQDLGVTINSVIINLNKIESGITTLLSSKSGAISPQILNFTIPAYTAANNQIQYFVTVYARNTIGQELSITTLDRPAIVNRKCSAISALNIKRSTVDIFGNNTNIQDASNGYANFYVPNNDEVIGYWDACADVDTEDMVSYNFTYGSTTKDIKTTSYLFIYTFVGINQSMALSAQSKDDYNTTAAISKTIYGVNPITTVPVLTLNCYEIYTGSGTPITINGTQVVDVTATYVPNGQITNILQLAVPAISGNATLQSHMRVAFEMYWGSDSTSWKLIKTYITSPGVFSAFIQHDILTDAINGVKFKVYYLDRFSIKSTADLTTSIYSVRTAIQVPQVMGTLGIGYRWLFGNMPAAADRLQLNKPTFFCKVLNRNAVTYTFKAELYNSSKVLIEALTDSGVNIMPNNTIATRISAYTPSENIKAFRFTTELALGSTYYIIIKIMNGAVIVSQSAFNENSMYVYSQSYDNKLWNNFWAQNIIIKSEHINTLNKYLTQLYRSYGYNDPILFDAVRNDIIYATTNNKSKTVTPQMVDPSVVEPTGNNLSPKFDQWIMTTPSQISNGNTQVLIDSANPDATSLFIPWKNRGNALKLDFVAIVNSGDNDKLFRLDINFYDYDKNLIPNYTQTLILVTPATSEITYADGTELTYSNTYSSDILSMDVSYIKIKFSKYNGTNGLSAVSLKEVFLTSNTGLTYSAYTTNDYSPVSYSYGSKQTAYAQLKSEFLRLVNLIKADVTSTGITFPAVPTIATPNYTLDSKIIAAGDITNLAVDQNGIFGYLKTF